MRPEPVEPMCFTGSMAPAAGKHRRNHPVGPTAPDGTTQRTARTGERRRSGRFTTSDEPSGDGGDVCPPLDHAAPLPPSRRGVYPR
ncbi:hypothetical protein MBT84_03915 [Streptomyces sp. MBT84]|nr:hypothetical protein [Streptomyces sp. MBT84]